MDKAVHTSPADAAEAAKQRAAEAMDVTHRNIDQAVAWLKRQVGQDS
jgi:hypothetical protein